MFWLFVLLFFFPQLNQKKYHVWPILEERVLTYLNLLWTQVYRDVFGCFIREFKTYQPLLSAIKKEYETTLGQ